MTLFREAIDAPNAFPRGFYWTGIKGVPIVPAVEELLSAARAKGVKAANVAIETFDALMLRIWRNLPGKSPEPDKKVRKSQAASVSIPLPGAGTGKPIKHGLHRRLQSKRVDGGADAKTVCRFVEVGFGGAECVGAGDAELRHAPLFIVAVGGVEPQVGGLTAGEDVAVTMAVAIVAGP